MGRADKQLYNQQQSQQMAANNALMQQELAQRNQAQAAMMPQLQSILAHPGYTPAQQQSILGNTMSALGGSFGDAQQQMANQAARTGNSAGFLPAEEEMGREKARDMTSAAAGLTQQFANAGLNQQMQALADLGNLYNSAAPVLNAALGSNTNLVGDQARLAGIPGAGGNLTLGGLRTGLTAVPLLGLG
jgi:hypothetical protein